MVMKSQYFNDVNSPPNEQMYMYIENTIKLKDQ